MSHDHHMMAAAESTTAGHNHGDMSTSMDGSTTAHQCGMHDGMGGMSMQMYFVAGYEAVVLFKEWDIQSVGAMVGSCIGIFLMGILYEGIKYFRERLNRKNYVAIDYSKVRVPEGSDGSQVSQVKTTVSFKTSMTSWSHYIQTSLHLVQLILSYFLMLIAMTFNVWLFIAVILGCTCGYFLFGWQKTFLVDTTEHCH